MIENALDDVQLEEILAPYHPESPKKFEEELQIAERLALLFFSRATSIFLLKFSSSGLVGTLEVTKKGMWVFGFFSTLRKTIENDKEPLYTKHSHQQDRSSLTLHHYCDIICSRLLDPEICRFLMDFVDSAYSGIKPLLITDWDGTMKDYCSQYATNLQPVYSAVVMGRFAELFTRATAVLTAGPLRGPGILDLTALPINGPVLFSGSWGREWWLRGKRVVHEDGISEEGFDAIGRLSDEMTDLLANGDFAQFALVGSGVQRKVDRLTLGVQTVFGHIPLELVVRYIDAIKERIHRVDPNNTNLVLENSSPLEIEVCAHNSGANFVSRSVWNKGDGVASLIESLHDSLKKGKVLVAGDTASDLPMLKHAGVMALFVGAGESLRDSVRSIVGDDSRICFVSCPDVIHAAFARVLTAKVDLD
ncbi:unnamed protein product [Strongylus vulgaris]|uniref:Trehalose-6-phosphate phosphatase C-terminal domain-containing protein n=1 Tax=Strongylus vulgaris TaxID=40348 RepID=A0A3P7JAT5_STRVU|nr:unnamed protein product [Strongylus vulgaris]